MDVNPGIMQHEDTSQSMHDVNSNSYLLKKICHWGPLSTIGIISIITLTTLDCEGQYEGIPSFTAFFMFTSLSTFTIIHFISAIIEGPGFLPLRWMPEEATNKQYLQFCTVCQGYKAPRSHHCRKCGRCVMKMDHHCPWINTCVGHYNHGYFTAFLATAVAGCWLSTYILISWIKAVLTQSSRLPFPPPTVFRLILVVFSIGLSIGVVFAVGVLLYIQILTIIRNRTEIEDWILEKAQYRRKDTDDKYVHPYSKGWRFNVKQVFGTFGYYPAGDGITWPVIDGCDQYTLTREQLAQKQDKRNRARRYRIIKNATESRFPIGHGFGVFFHPPCTDEPRIKLEVGDIVVVTRWKKYWLFGEKEQKGGNGSKRVRGWLPRPCTIEVIEGDLHGSDLYSLSNKND